MSEKIKKSDSYRKDFRVVNGQYSQNNTGKSFFEHGRKDGQNFHRTSTKQRQVNLKLKKTNKFLSSRTSKSFCRVGGLFPHIKKYLQDTSY